MAGFDITNPITSYSTHFFPRDADIPVFIMVYKSGPSSFDDVAGYLMFTDKPSAGLFRDRVSPTSSYIVKHFPLARFGDVQALLRHRLDYLKQPMSIHYIGDEIEGGWTTLDAGASPGLDPELTSLVTSATAKSVTSNGHANAKPARAKKKLVKK
jgi:hypothetical protein